MQKRIAVINDLSGFGRCALSISMPVLSVAGLEVCALPTALLSTHFAFPNPVYIDTTDNFRQITDHWQSLSLQFDGIFTGFIGSLEQISMVSDFIDTFRSDTNFIIVDPTMADNGKFYSSPIFNEEYLSEMKKLCQKADIILPNITEACMLTNTVYKEGPYEQNYIENLLDKLLDLGTKCALITGVYGNNSETGCALKERDKETVYIKTLRQPGKYWGTGDVFGSTFAGAVLNGHSYENAAAIAVNFTSDCIAKSNETNTDNIHGINFEQCLANLSAYL